MGKSRLALAVLLLAAYDKQPAQDKLVYQGGTFPSPLARQGRASLPPPREVRASFGSVRA